MINDPGVNALEGVVGCGDRLRTARVSAGMSVEEVAGRLHMPVQVVLALEDERWEKLGAPVFIRGQLKSYARLLNVDLDGLLAHARFDAVAPAPLVSHTHTPRARRMLESAGRRAVYVVITAVLAVPVWYASRGLFSEVPPNTASLDVYPLQQLSDVAANPQSAPEGDPVASRPAVAAPVERGAGAAPYTASMAPMPKPAASKEVSLSFAGDSWAEIFAPDGAVVERTLIRAGESRTFKVGEVGRMKLGNASEVAVQASGAAVDLAPYRSRANVAHFAVSSDGYVTPVNH